MIAPLAHAARAWNRLTVCQRLGPAPHLIPEGDQVSPLSSVIWLTWCRLLRRSADVCIELYNSLRCRFCKVFPQLRDGSIVIHDICSSSRPSSRQADASPRLWSQLPDLFRQPSQSCLDSSYLLVIISTLIIHTPSLFHSGSKVKTYLFNKSFPLP